jgi:hypothetical protein
MEIRWTNIVRNKVVLYSIKEEGISYIQQEEGRVTGLVTACI